MSQGACPEVSSRVVLSYFPSADEVELFPAAGGVELYCKTRGILQSFVVRGWLQGLILVFECTVRRG